MAEFLVAQLVAEMLQSFGHGVPSAVFGERQFRFAPTDVARIHDLVGLTMLEDSILMDAGTVSKSVLANDRLAASHHQAAHATNQARRFHDLAGVHFGVKVFEVIGPRLDRHHDFFDSGVTGAFADAVDGSLDLARAGLDGGDRIRHGHARDHCGNAR